MIKKFIDIEKCETEEQKTYQLTLQRYEFISNIYNPELRFLREGSPTVAQFYYYAFSEDLCAKIRAQQNLRELTLVNAIMS